MGVNGNGRPVPGLFGAQVSNSRLPGCYTRAAFGRLKPSATFGRCGTAYDIEEVRRKYIGFETAKSKGRYPVEYDPIRRHCHMVDDNNPLFTDPAYAQQTSHGAVLAPPSGWLALYFASLGPWPAVFEPLFPIVPTPGKRIVNMSQETEWFSRIKVGDHLSVTRRVADVFQKGISIDPEAVWIVAEAEITNQRDELVCVIRNTLLTHRTPEEVAAAGDPSIPQGER